MRPWKIFAMLVTLNALLFALQCFLPNELEVSKELTVKIPHTEELFPKHQEKEEIQELAQSHFQLTDLDVDTFGIDSSVQLDFKSGIQQLIEFENGPDDLDAFFNQLQKADDDKVRIMYFGDSQIEGDRISGVLRNYLQSEFGGCGPGLMAVKEAYDNFKIVKKSADNWQKRMGFANYLKSTTENKYFGATGYVHEIKKGSNGDGLMLNASISLSPNKSYYSLANQYEELRLIYNDLNDDCVLKIKGENEDSLLVILDQTNQVKEKVIPTSNLGESLNLEYKGLDSPSVYGICLECEEGVVVDNIAWRGSSGMEFSKWDQENLRQQFQILEPSLIIYHYGVNVVPYLTDNFDYFERMVSKQLRTLKRLAPNSAILVIGVSDMSEKEGSNYVSYRNIEKIRDAQKRAAFANGCAFWDVYELMGGENSMPAWVFAKPSLAAKDFTHLNHRGAKIIGEKLYQALMEAYNNHINLSGYDENE